MASNLSIFVKIAGIDGESTVKGHEKEIEALSYEQTLDATIVHAGAGGAGAGKTAFSAVRFRKSVDAASIPLLLACASGQHIAQARFAFTRAGGAAFFTITLDDVLVAHVAQRAGVGAQYPLSFDTLAAGAPSDGFVDEVALDCARIAWEYRAQGPQGQPGAVVTGGWDVRQNRRL